ncbi:hypothetical protein J6590_103542 [Homalodisca vitripennis]|nr:hypothetical protein J6590_103542 [Homalodisca vitripennis]
MDVASLNDPIVASAFHWKTGSTNELWTKGRNKGNGREVQPFQPLLLSRVDELSVGKWLLREIHWNGDCRLFAPPQTAKEQENDFHHPCHHYFCNLGHQKTDAATDLIPGMSSPHPMEKVGDAEAQERATLWTECLLLGHAGCSRADAIPLGTQRLMLLPAGGKMRTNRSSLLTSS